MIMRIIKTAITSMLFMAGVNLAAADRLQVIDRGQDGDQRLYMVVCPDGNRSSVVQTFEVANGKTALKQVCIFPHNGQDECRPDWDLDAAAEASCR
jgi:hypothetical protein